MTNYRVIVELDPDATIDGCDGKPLPESREVYEQNYMNDKQGKRVPYEEYVRYYGNPDRHVMLGIRVQRQCSECGSWKDAESLWGIDFMDDDSDADRTGTFTTDRVLAWPADSYLRMEALELLKDAGYEVPNGSLVTT